MTNQVHLRKLYEGVRIIRTTHLCYYCLHLDIKIVGLTYTYFSNIKFLFP